MLDWIMFFLMLKSHNGISNNVFHIAISSLNGARNLRVLYVHSGFCVPSASYS